MKHPPRRTPLAGLFGWVCGKGISPPQGGGIEVIGVPTDIGNVYASGPRLGPAAIRKSSLRLTCPASRGQDRGDVEAFDDADWMQVIERTRASVVGIVNAGAFPLLLGGDHAVSYAAVAAFACFESIDIAWFDAHTDFCQLTGSGWHNHKQVLRRIADLGHVNRMTVIGHRGLTYFDESRQWPTLEVVGCGPGGKAPPLPDGWMSRSCPLYVSVDIDVLDPSVTPGTGHPVPGGLDVSTLCGMLRALVGQRRVIGADIMEVNPLLDCEEKTSLAAAEILSSLVDALAHQKVTPKSAWIPPKPERGLTASDRA